MLKKITDTENNFLKSYKWHEFATPLLSIDPVLFTYRFGQLRVLLVKRSNHPDKGLWGLPSGFVDMEHDETLEATALRKLYEKTHVKPPYLEQLYSFGNSSRDKRAWSVSIAYTALIAHQECQAYIETLSDTQWWVYETLDEIKLAIDHRQIIDFARERLRQKALYSIVPAYALSEKFTLPELQHLHEVLIGKKLPKKSFRRRIEQAGLLIDTGEKQMDSGGRPATLYRMKETARHYTFIRNLEE
ncbi:MAG: NUDIX hydrolase [Proteobacteria bacterium]|nr:MAG: NUDIX hydrolase [Pseudomonadota bacterium]